MLYRWWIVWTVYLQLCVEPGFCGETLEVGLLWRWSRLITKAGVLYHCIDQSQLSSNACPKNRNFRELSAWKPTKEQNNALNCILNADHIIETEEIQWVWAAPGISYTGFADEHVCSIYRTLEAMIWWW